jgi:hypothetical protein
MGYRHFLLGFLEIPALFYGNCMNKGFSKVLAKTQKSTIVLLFKDLGSWNQQNLAKITKSILVFKDF